MSLVPRSNNVIRVNGTARICADETRRRHFTRDGKLPRPIIVAGIADLFTMRSRHGIGAGTCAGGDQSAGLPTVGNFPSEMTAGRVDGAAYDLERPARAA